MEQNGLSVFRQELAEAAGLVLGDELVFSLVYEEPATNPTKVRYLICLDRQGRCQREESSIQGLFDALCEKYGMLSDCNNAGEVVSKELLIWVLAMMRDWLPDTKGITQYEVYRAVRLLSLVAEQSPAFCKMNELGLLCKSWVKVRKKYIVEAYLSGLNTEARSLLELFAMAKIHFLQKTPQDDDW